MLDPENVQPGDVRIALPSSGVHSNGFSLVRKVFELESKPRNIFREFNGSTLGETLLTPTRLYVKPMLKLMDEIKVKSVVHVPGGGFYENVPRMLKDGQGVSIDLTTYPHKPIFDFIAKTGDIPMKEMCNVFNMGIGFMMAVDKADVEKVQSLLQEIGEESYVIGEVTDSGSVDLTW